MTPQKTMFILGPMCGVDSTYNNQNISFIHIEYNVFSGGEVYLDLQHNAKTLPNIVRARIQSSNDVMALISLGDIFSKFGHVVETLQIPYFPYARQDRYTTNTNSFSLKWFADIINKFPTKQVTCYDPHSQVTPALINGFADIPLPTDYIYNITKIVDKNTTVISPDAGGYKRAALMAEKLNLELATGIKVRNPSTGKITDARVFGDVSETAIIVDDICDGGRTFIALADYLKKNKGCKKVYLAVTHGIFSQGLNVFDGYIDRIFTTTSFVTKYIDPSRNGFSNDDRLVYADIEVP